MGLVKVVLWTCGCPPSSPVSPVTAMVLLLTCLHTEDTCREVSIIPRLEVIGSKKVSRRSFLWLIATLSLLNLLLLVTVWPVEDLPRRKRLVVVKLRVSRVPQVTRSKRAPREERVVLNLSRARVLRPTTWNTGPTTGQGPVGTTKKT